MSPMPRMRPATRSGWNSSSASIFSPDPVSLIGAPVIARMDSAAPPRASPSMRVMTMPVTPTASLKARAVLTASCPVMASTTSSVSAGLVAARTARTSSISTASMDSRPAVSSTTTSNTSRRAVSSARCAISSGVWPGTIVRLVTPACCASCCSWSCAAGRCTSRLASSTFLRCRCASRSPSLPEVVVLPEPCRPTIRNTTGAAAARFSGAAPSPPSASTITSLTILTTCWPGETLSSTSTPTARSRTLAMKSRTTGNATSASSSASLTSRRASATSSSLSEPRRRRRSNTPESLPDSDSNTAVAQPPTTEAPVRDTRGPTEPGVWAGLAVGVKRPSNLKN